MLMIPLETENHVADAVLVVLGKDNIDRMREADPVEVILRQTPRHLVNPTILICLEEQQADLMRVVNTGDVHAVIAYLQRGWKYRPEAGDHDRGPESIKDSN